MTIFRTSDLYPDEFTPFLSHFYEFEEVFIAFSPFIQINDDFQGERTAYQTITSEKAVEQTPLLQGLGQSSATIYGLNDHYPTDDIIAKKGKPYHWQDIINNTTFENFLELHKGLMTQIGRLRAELERKDLGNALNDYVVKNALWYPIEGVFNYFSKKAIYSCLKELDSWLVYAETEFYEEKKQFNLNLITQEDFIKSLEKYKYLYTSDKTLLFSIEWDSCFFIIAIKGVKKSIIEKYFEGFWATSQDSHSWTWNEAELNYIKSL